MVVTQSLAKGVLREVVRKQSDTREELSARMRIAGLRPPSTKRGFAGWFRERVAIHEREALLIVHGMAGRRTGAFAAYSPTFLEHDSAWTVQISLLYIEFRPGRIDRIETETLPVTISGHALERMFQRTDSIDWRITRDCLAGAVLFANAAARAWLESGCEQCAVLAEKGMLVGRIVDGTLHLRTFLPESQLGARWSALHRDLKAYSEEHKQAINAAALGSSDDVGNVFGQLLESGSHRWLFRSYAPGEDPDEDAWRAHELVQKPEARVGSVLSQN